MRDGQGGPAIPQLNKAVLRRLRIETERGFVTLGYPPLAAREARREVVRWAVARKTIATRRRTRLFAGSAVAWIHPGYAELVPTDVPSAGAGEVTVETHVSVISPGTERAFFVGLANTDSRRDAWPGGSLAGLVLASGPGVEVAPGDLVAITGGRHASVVTVPVRNVYAVPDGVPIGAAAMVRLGVIAAQGVRLARLRPDTPFGVVGAGLVGALALRVGASAGAEPAAVVARSRSKEAAARAGGAQRLLVHPDSADEIAALALPVVIEATGDPDAIGLAVSAAGSEGRVVLLGSPRGVTSHFPVEEIRAKRLELVGAHVDTLALEGGADGLDREREEAETFLRHLGERRLVIDDLLGEAVDPREAGLFYRALTRRRDLVGAHFDWTRLASDERARHGHALRPPDVRARGVEPHWRPLAPNGRGGGLWHSLGLSDPFVGASGELRIGLLGCGEIAVSNASAAASAPNTRLVACYDPVAALARDLAARFGAEAEPTVEAVLERADVDAVVLSVPHDLHGPLAVMAADSGRHVIVEKPMAHTLAAAREMTAAVERAGVALSVCFPQRYQPEVQVARRLVAEGALGQLGGLSLRFLLDKAPAYWVGGYGGRSPSTWRSSRARAGGGMLIMNFPHNLDLIRHVFGVEALEVCGAARAVDDSAEVEDTFSLTVRFTGDALGTVVGGSAVRGAFTSDFAAWGSSGHIVLEPSPRVFSLRAVAGLRTSRWHSFGRLPKWDERAVFLSRLATAIDQGRPPEVSAADGLAVQTFVEAAYRSSGLRRAVRLSELDPEGEPR